MKELIIAICTTSFLVMLWVALGVYVIELLLTINGRDIPRWYSRAGTIAIAIPLGVELVTGVWLMLMERT